MANQVNQGGQPPQATEDEIRLQVLEEMKSAGGKKGLSLGNPMVNMVVVAVVVVAIAIMGLAMSGGGVFVTKDDFTKNVGGIAQTLSTVQTDLGKARNDLTTMSTRIQEQVTTAVANGTSTINDKLNNLTAVSTSNAQGIENVRNDVNALKSTEIATLKQQVADLTTKVNVLTATPTPTTPSGSVTNGAITYSVKDLGTELLAESFNFTDDETIKVTLTNTGTTEVSDLRFYLYLQINDGRLPLSYINTPMSLTGDLAMTLVSSDTDEFKFKSARVTIGAGKTKTLYFTPNVNLKRLSDYPYQDKDGNPCLTNTDAALAPYTNNPEYSVSRLADDLEFIEDVELIDYN